MTKKTIKQKKSTKKTSKEVNEELNNAIKKIEGDNIDELNKALSSKNYNELVDFVMRISGSKDLQLMFRLLARLQSNPQSFRGDNAFNTLYNTAMMDGERELVRRFANLIAYANDGNRDDIERAVTQSNIL